MKMFRTFL